MKFSFSFFGFFREEEPLFPFFLLEDLRNLFFAMQVAPASATTVEWFAKQLAEATLSQEEKDRVLQSQHDARELAANGGGPKMSAATSFGPMGRKLDRMPSMVEKATAEQHLDVHWRSAKFLVPVKCFVCSDKIFGIKGQKGLKCKHCSKGLHIKCMEKLRLEVATFFVVGQQSVSKRVSSILAVLIVVLSTKKPSSTP